MIRLGDTVKDKISGFTGVVTGKHYYLWGCIRCSVLSKELQDGKPIEEMLFDEAQLEYVSSSNLGFREIPEAEAAPAGPRPAPKPRAAPKY